MIQRPKADISAMVIAPMPGMVKSVGVKVGDSVSFKMHIIYKFLNCLHPKASDRLDFGAAQRLFGLFVIRKGVKTESPM
jgi:hypothetical protein